MKKKYVAVIAGIFTLSCLSSLPIANAVETDSYTMNVSVNLAGEKKSISPYIYGINDQAGLDYVTVNSIRQGGNRTTAYNWENNYSNAGSDWHNSSDNYMGEESDGPAYPAIDLSNDAAEKNVEYKLTTLQMAGYVAADNSGYITEEAPSSHWNEVIFRKNGELSLTPDLNDGVVYMDEYVNYLVQTLGDSNSTTGYQGYSLDNEPALWSYTHSLVHPEKVTCQELVEKSIELAGVVKDIDADAEIFGPALFGFSAYYNLSEADDWSEISQGKDYSLFIDYYLEQMKLAEQQEGRRLLDVLDIHYYSEDCADTESRLQSVRSLYDSSYVEDSWIGQWFSSYLPILDTVTNSINEYYPDTKLAISEYDFKGGDEVSGAIAEAEALGTFADYGVYLATYWGTVSEAPYTAAGINLYTNYDGEGSSFGNTLVEAQTDDVSLATAYASIQDNNEDTVTLVLSNKSMSQTEKAVIDLSGTSVEYSSATVYAITEDSSDIYVLDVINDVTNNTVTVELPPLSVAQIVIDADESLAEVTEKPETYQITETFEMSELSVNELGNYLIPLGDKEHIKEIIINADLSSSINASSVSGGGGICFNNLIDENGETFWGSESFSFSSVGNCNAVVKMDGIFKNSDGDEVSAEIGDDTAELQQWWVYSSEDSSGSDVTIKYNSVQIIYEYDGTDPDADTTTTVVTTTVTSETEPDTTTVSSEPDTTTVTSVTSSSQSAEETEEVFDISELEKTADGAYIIPISSPNVKEIIINTTVSCESNASSYVAGGAVCFNELTNTVSSSFWGAKSFSASSGTSDVVISMDGTFTDGNEDVVSASLENCSYAELQNWWAWSETSNSGDDVTMTFNKVTVVYESEDVSTTTSEPDVTSTTSESDSTTSEPDVTTVTSESDTTVSEPDVTTVTSESDTTVSEPDITISNSDSDTTTSETEDSGLLGDLNEDGKISTIDLVLMKQAITADKTAPNSDMNGDGKLSVMDFIALKKILLS